MSEMISISSACHQYFSLPPVIIQNIVKHPVSAQGFMKLYKTCKYFFLKKRIFFFANFFHQYVNENGFFHLGWDYQTENEKVLFWFTRKLRIWCAEYFPSHQIYRCTIQKFTLKVTNLPLTDFDIIVKENTIKIFLILNSQILKSDGSDTTICEILQKLPNVVKIFYRIDETIIKSETLKNLKLIKFWNKLQRFSLEMNYSADIFNPSILCYFIKINAAPSSNFEIIVKGANSENNYNLLKDAAKKLIESWIDGEKPEISVYHLNRP